MSTKKQANDGGMAIASQNRIEIIKRLRETGDRDLIALANMLRDDLALETLLSATKARDGEKC